MTTNNKVPLALAADNFATICKAIDEGDINEAITSLFHETKLDLADSVARRICFFEFLDGAIKNATEIRDSWKQRVEQLKHVEERVKKLTLDIITAESTIEYRSDLGKLCAQQNPPSLKLNFETTKMNASNVINAKDIERNHIPQELITEVRFLQLNTEKLKEQLNAGGAYPWASLTRGQHLRIRK